MKLLLIETGTRTLRLLQITYITMGFPKQVSLVKLTFLQENFQEKLVRFSEMKI